MDPKPAALYDCLSSATMLVLRFCMAFNFSIPSAGSWDPLALPVEYGSSEISFSRRFFSYFNRSNASTFFRCVTSFSRSFSADFFQWVCTTPRSSSARAMPDSISRWEAGAAVPLSVWKAINQPIHPTRTHYSDKKTRIFSHFAHHCNGLYSKKLNRKPK